MPDTDQNTWSVSVELEQLHPRVRDVITSRRFHDVADRAGALAGVGSDTLLELKRELMTAVLGYEDIDEYEVEVEIRPDMNPEQSETFIATVQTELLIDILPYLNIEYWDELPEPIKTSIESGRYKTFVASALKSGADEQVVKRLQYEVLLVLMGIKTVLQFEEDVQQSPVVSAEEGVAFSKKMREGLFAELALYLPNLNVPENEALLLMLTSSIRDDDAVRTRLARLPESVQTVIQSRALEDTFASIQKRHHLEEPTARALAGQVVRVMVGLTNMNDFKVSVTRVAGIPPSSLDALFLDVEQGLFKPVRTAILHALQKNMGSLPTKESTQSNDPYRTPAR